MEILVPKDHRALLGHADYRDHKVLKVFRGPREIEVLRVSKGLMVRKDHKEKKGPKVL